MNAASMQTSLKVLAAGLAVAIVVLGLTWLRGDPAPPPGTVLAATATDERAASPAGTRAESNQPESAARPDVAKAEHPAAAQPSGAVLYGTVVSTDGEPVNGYLWLSRGAEEVGTDSLRDEERAFAFAGLSPGSYRLTSRFDDQLPILRDVQVEAPLTRIDVKLDPRWRLMVHAVTSDGTPFQQAVGKAVPQSSMQRDIGAIALLEPLVGDLPPGSGGHDSAGLGIFRGADPTWGKVLPKTAIGVLTLPADRPVHVALMMGNVMLAQQPASPGQAELTFTLAPEALLGKLAKLRLRVVDEHGAPITGMQVNLDGSFNPRSKTDDEGRIEFTNVPPGRRRCSMFAKGLLGPPLEIDLTTGVEVDLGDVVVREPAQFELALDNFNGSGGVYFYLLDGPSLPGVRFDDQYYSAENGKRARTNLFPGRYAALARSKNGVSVRTIDTALMAGQTLTFDLARGASVRFTGDLVLPLQVEIRSRAGQPVFRREVSGKIGYSIELPVGDYDVTILHPDRTVTNKTLHVPAAGAELLLP